MRVFDIVIIGAATTGAYFGRLMAEKGFSTLVIDSLAEKDIGTRLSCIHLDRTYFEESGIPAPMLGDNDYLTSYEYNMNESAYGHYPIKTNYHLEMAFQDESFAKEVVRLVERLYMNPKLIKRRNLYVVYLKRAQEIADFIASIGATNCYLDFENYRMTRDFYNSDNRLANCDIANAVRTNMAALSQLEDIGVIKNSIGIEVLPNDLQVLCNLRLENQESSLRELATLFSEKTNKAITKSGINHLFSKVKMIADDYRGKKK